MSRLTKDSSFPSTASTSQEDLENGSSSTSSRKLRVTLLSSEWKSTKGGLSTINRELAIQLAKHPNVEVSVYLPQCSEDDKRVATSHHVRLIEAEEMPGLEPDLWLSFFPDDHAVDCVIGHGVHLGRQVQLIKRHQNCKWIQVVHTAPEELGMYKSHADTISKGEKKHQVEVKLCKLADQVVAIGPKLAEAFSGYLRSCGKDQDVLNLTPGIFSEFGDLKQATEERRTFCVLVFGRGDSEDFQLKGYDIAAQAIAELKDMTYKLVFVGAPSGEEEKVKEMLLQQGIDRSQLRVRCFKESREQLAELFCEVDLAIMPSRTEGFGLAALEALSAGLPVLVSGNSGLGEALKKVLYGSNCVVESEDPKEWAKAIRDVRKKDRKLRLQESKVLCGEYAKKYIWEEQCDRLVERMVTITLEDNADEQDLSLKASDGDPLHSRSFHKARLPLRIDCEAITGPGPQVELTGMGEIVGNSGKPSAQDFLMAVGSRYLQTMKPSTSEDFDGFLHYLQEIRKVVVVDTHFGSLIVTVECGSLQILDELWEDYCSGHLNEMVQKFLVTEDTLKEFGLTEVKLVTTIEKEDYRACRECFLKPPGSKRSDANAASSSQEGSGDPPQLSTDVPSMSNIQVITKPSKHAHLPVDVLLVTVKNCEFLACYNELTHPYRCYFDGLGYVYFSDVNHESQEGKVKIALLRCYKGGIGPSATLISVKNAVNVLRPKAVISVGTCSALNPEETKLGDVVVSAKIATYASKVVKGYREQSTGIRSFVSRRFLDIIKHCADGWQAPLKNPEAQEIKVHSDGEFLSGPEQVTAEWRREQLAASNPQATAIEMEGEGIFTVAFDSQVEWLIVKGIADYADGAQLTTQSWSPFASVMAASLVTHILSDPCVFQSWPHYQDSLEQSSASKSKGKSPFPGDSVTTFLEWSQSQLRSFYNTSASQVMITPWDPDNTMDIDEVYVQLSLLRDDRKLTGTTKEKLKDYSEIFASHGHHLTPKRILVYGRPGIGKSTFSKKLAVDWSRSEKEILKKFAVVLLIKLRDVCNTQDFCAMLKKAELLSADDPVVFNQLYDYVIQNQQKVLLVLDGFDEYSAEKSSPVHQIWRGSQLRNCTVLVTTRPSKENELRPCSHVLFEVSGFEDIDKIKQFAVKFLSSREDVDYFIGFLSKHQLWGVAEIPLLLLMLVLTWKEKVKGHQVLLTSRADLYISFCQTLLYHISAKTSYKEFRSIDEYKEDLAKLGELAFDALLNDCLYFKLSKLPEDIRLLVEKFIVVGFLQISKLSSSPRPEEVAYFLHKTIQEFLSAFFIVQELTNTKEETFTCLSKVDSFEKVKKMEEVFRFVCELSSEATKEVFSHLRMIGEKEGLTKYSFTENPSVKEFSEDQREFHRFSLDYFLSCPASDRQDIYPLFLRCVNSVLVIDNQLPAIAREHFLRSSTLPKPDYLFFVERFKESVNDDVLSIICELETVIVTCYGDAKSISKNDKCLFDRLRCGEFFLKKKGQQMVFYLTCICNEWVNQCLQSAQLLNALISTPESPLQKPVDHVSQNHDASSSLDLNEKTSDHTQKHSLSFVREVDIKVHGEETRKTLTVVNNILPFLSRPQVIKIYWVSSNKVIEQDCAQLKESLVSRIPFTNNLVSLELYNIWCTANSKCAADFARSLREAPNLDTLVLSNVDMGDQECQILVTSLKNLDTLKVLRLSRNPLGQGITELAQHLHGVPLTELDLNDTQMGEEEVTAVARSLQYVPQLMKLSLHTNRLGSGITELAKHLHCVPHLTLLNLNDTQMGEEEVTAVARCLQYVPQLMELFLHTNPLGHGTTELAKHLHCVPHLTRLDLNDTQMGEEEVTAVARGLKYVPKLRLLNLSHNPLDRGVTELIQCLSSIPPPSIKGIMLSGVRMTKKEASELCTAVAQERFSLLRTDYHFWDNSLQRNQLYTEVELQERGVTYDDE